MLHGVDAFVLEAVAIGHGLAVDLDRTVQISYTLLQLSRRSPETRALYEQAHAELEHSPDVERVATAEADPFYSGRAIAPRSPDRPEESLWREGEAPCITAVGQGFFAAVGSRSLRGRDFQASDRAGAERVAIVTTTLSRRLFPGVDAIGKCMWLDRQRECVSSRRYSWRRMEA